MDSDPFAVWSDPAPAPAPAPSASTSSATQAQAASSPADARDAARLSLEYEDEDPGWGAPSASTSRANSPEKARKQAPALSSAHISPIVEDEMLAKTDAAVSLPKESLNAPHAPDTPADETAVGAEMAVEAAPQDAQVDESSTADNVSRRASLATDKTDTSEHPRHVETEHAEERSSEAKVTTTTSAEEEEDAFDDFGSPLEPSDSGAAHDDFGDFDDFDTSSPQNVADFGDDDGFGDAGFDEPDAAPAVATPPAPASAPAHVRTWTPLEVTSRSNRLGLADSIAALLPLSMAAEKELTTAGLRQVEGLSQVLVSESSRQLWADLSSFPSVRPIDWVRSKTRRDYLISMGVPVNLDEIHSSFASGSGGSRRLPPLQLKYDASANRDSNGTGLQRSSSLKVGGTSSGHPVTAQRSASTSNSPRDGSSSPALGSSTNRELIAERRMQELGLGPAPQVDLRRAQELVNKTEDQLTLLSLPALKSLLRELNTLTTSTSSLLTHHLTLRESYQADSEMYNSMIKELVTGAASRFSGGGSGGSGSNSVSGGRGDSRRTTLMGASVSNSGKARASRFSAESAAMGGTRSMSPSISPSLRGGAASAPRR